MYLFLKFSFLVFQGHFFLVFTLLCWLLLSQSLANYNHRVYIILNVIFVTQDSKIMSLLDLSANLVLHLYHRWRSVCLGIIVQFNTLVCSFPTSHGFLSSFSLSIPLKKLFGVAYDSITFTIFIVSIFTKL